MARLLIIGKFPFPVGAAASKRIENISSGFIANGWEVDVVNFGEADSKGESTIAGLDHNPLFPLKKGRIWPGQWALFISPRCLARRLPALCAARNYDAAYVYGRAASINKPIFAALKRAKVFIINDINEAPEHFYGTGGRLSPNYWNGWLGFHRSALRSDLVAGISREICDYYKKKGVSALCIPSIEDFESGPLPFPEWDSEQGPNLLYVGAMFERDRPSWMLSLLGVLAQKGVPFKLNLVGSFLERRDAQKLLQKVVCEYPSLEPRLVKHGRVSDVKLNELTAASSFCFILRRDNIAERCSFPTRLVEYLRAGRCVISSQVPDVPLYLRDKKDAILLPQADLVWDASILEEFFADFKKSRKLAGSGRSQAEVSFCRNEHMRRLIEKIESLRPHNV